MKPLAAKSAKELLERIDYARQGELRSLTMQNPTTFTLRLSVQDNARDFDWIDIIFEMSGVSDARLLDDTQLKHLDMDEGVSVIVENGAAALCVGSYDSVSAAANAPLYLIGSACKFEEAPFSG